MLNVGKSNNNPKHIIISPLTIPSVEEFLVKKDPTEDAMAARDMKTIENPKQNSNEPLNLFCIVFSAPENIVRYPGTSGNTQGEKKDSIPKTNDRKIFTSID